MASGLPLSDGREDKTFDELLDSPDIGDMFAFDYPEGAPAAAPARNFDPGRIRVEALFEALYGACSKGQVSPKLNSIAWVPGHGGGKLPITTAQGADKAFQAVSRELDGLPSSFTQISRTVGRHLQLPPDRRHVAHVRCTATVWRSISTRNTRPTGSGTAQKAGRTRFRARSSTYSRSTDSSGAGAGIITTPCISSIAPISSGRK